MKCLDSDLCNDVTIREGVCSLDTVGKKYEKIVGPFKELEFAEITKHFEQRWLNIETNLRNMYFQNAFKLHGERGNFDFSFAYR